MPEKLNPIPITPVKQTYEASCGPASISMVLSGFGIDMSEQTLVENYFPNASIPVSAWDPNKGVIPGAFDVDIVIGLVKVIKDLGLVDNLQIDVFAPPLYQYTYSNENRYIVKASHGAARKHGKLFKDATELRDFYDTLEQFSRRGDIGVYTANSRMMRFSRNYTSTLPDEVRKGFNTELFDFIRQGHIFGPHGGMTAHVRTIDGTRLERLNYEPYEEGFIMIDPADLRTYVMTPHSLVWVDSAGVRGDTFDHIFRVSPRTQELRPPLRSFLRFLQNLRG